jgi:hypothetical protein
MFKRVLGWQLTFSYLIKEGVGETDHPSEGKFRVVTGSSSLLEWKTKTPIRKAEGLCSEACGIRRIGLEGVLCLLGRFGL